MTKFAIIIGAKGDPGINGIGVPGNNGSDGQFLATYMWQIRYIV